MWLLDLQCSRTRCLVRDLSASCVLLRNLKGNFVTPVFQVQPGPPPCPVFYPEKQEITLPPDGLWVLRFPYAYVTERGPCFPPKENVQLMSYKVLRGVLKAVTQ